MSFWKLSLKYHAPATISGFVFFYLALKLLDNNNFIELHPVPTLSILLIIANFCAYLLYRSTKDNKAKDPTQFDVIDNKIEGNEVDGSLNIGMKVGKEESQRIAIKKNEIRNNKVKGDIVIGSSKEK